MTAVSIPASTSLRSTSPWPTFAVCAIAAYISTLDLSIVNVAFAEIARTFPGSSRSTISWVVTAYSILFGALLVVSGRLADRLGRKRVFQQGVALFLAGSVVCAAAPSLTLLVAGRAVQGVGGAMMTPAAIGLLIAAFSQAQRSKVVAWNGAIGALGVASGPTLGAFVIDSFGWRAAFWINVPICAVAFVMGTRVLHESPRQESTRPDVSGSVLLTLGVAALVWSISRVESTSWTDPTVVSLAVIALVFVGAVIHRSRSHPEPLLPPELFRERTFSAANFSSILFGAAFAGMILNNVLFLRTIWGYGVLEAGWLSVLAPTTVAVVSFVVGRVMGRIGFRRLLIAGPLGFALTAILQVRLLDVERQPWTHWLPLMVLLGVSIGCTFPVLAAAAVNRLPPDRFALGGAINNTFRQIGAAIGVALVVTVQTASDGIAGFQDAWRVCAVAAVCAALVSLYQPRQVGG
ncbi:MAG TPA: DHA2 family efflux MFS transporter permease subunit [Ilumatobacteraceae bacterium]|nr:DHA2 family efflux MFS transporter permease subunit [Ilumatobacteraceae bacterium]